MDSFPAALRDRFLAAAEHVKLPLRTPLYTTIAPPRYIHFFTSGIASIVTTMEDGDSVEVGISGREGAAETIYLLGSEQGTNDCIIQVESFAFRMELDRFRAEFFSLEPVRAVLFHHLQYQTFLLGQIAACNRLHSVEERLARWLLMVSDRLDAPGFSLTQEFLADMIGSRRSTVTLSAGLLRRSGLIDYRRGNVDILDRHGLEQVACECYPISRKLLRKLRHVLPHSPTNHDR